MDCILSSLPHAENMHLLIVVLDVNKHNHSSVSYLLILRPTIRKLTYKAERIRIMVRSIDLGSMETVCTSIQLPRTRSRRLVFLSRGCEIRPNFRVGNPTSVPVPAEISDFELGNSDFRVKLERTIRPLWPLEAPLTW